jgi:hypothetical protein
MLQADTAFLAKLTARLDNRLTTTSNRMWVGREELRNLRRLAGMNITSAVVKNRRMRVATVKQFITQAKDHLMQRAAALVTQKLKPEPTSLNDSIVDAFRSTNAFYNKALRALSAAPVRP